MSLKSPRRCRPFTAKQLAVLAAVFLATGISSFVLWTFDPQITEDNRLLEMLQAGLLLSAAGVHFFRGGKGAAPVPDMRVRALLAFLCLGFALRELDIDKFGDPALWGTVEILARGITAAAFFLYLWRMKSHIPLIWTERWAIVAAPFCLLTFAGGFFYLLSGPFDNKIFAIPVSLSQLIEEVLELWACILLFASAPARGTECAEAEAAGPEQAKSSAPAGRKGERVELIEHESI